MKRKLTMTLAIIIASSSFVGCEQDTVDTSQLVIEEAIAQSYPGLPSDGSAIEEDLYELDDVNETEETNDITEEIQDKTSDETFEPMEEQQISVEDEQALVTNISVFVPEGAVEEEVIIFENPEITPNDTQTPVVQLDPTGSTPIPTIVDPPTVITEP